MWIITDKGRTVQDKSSSEANLSRGFTFPNYVVHEVSDNLDVKVGDTYDGEKLIINEKKRAEVRLAGVKHEIVEVSLRLNEATSLGFADVQQTYQAEKTVLEAEKTALEAVIAK